MGMTCKICEKWIETETKERLCEKCLEIKDNSFDIVCNNCGEIMNIQGKQSYYETDSGYVDFGADYGGFKYLRIGCNCGNRIKVGC